MQDTIHRAKLNPDSIKASLMVKLPAYILGVIIGFLVVWVAMILFGG